MKMNVFIEIRPYNVDTDGQIKQSSLPWVYSEMPKYWTDKEDYTKRYKVLIELPDLKPVLDAGGQAIQLEEIRPL